MSSLSPDNEMGQFVISSCFYKGFYFSVYWNYFSVRFLLAGIDDQTSRVNKFVLVLKHSVSIKRINNCNRLIALLDSFYAGKQVSLKLIPKGTPFQIKVWNKLVAIPFGQTKNYKQIAIEIGNPKACRAVGNACGKNPILLLIPCHRVIASDKKLGGFSASFSLKKTLLEIEGANLV
ncbi:MAG: methylated-DNA--[protein]-cysteine S-methyltransferase [Planctomycetota bacterium]|nr:methylated-DNA--[protein]-cysteine S-methyltransferase [Planctomycetota bacterium]